MTVDEFEESTKKTTPPDTSVYLAALWYDAKGDWQKAHSLVDSVSGKTAAAVHAYLHRAEGDNRNASYWYNRAGRTMPNSTLQEEWKALVSELLEAE